MDFQGLKAELNTDPVSLGYATTAPNWFTDSSHDVALAALINDATKRTITNVPVVSWRIAGCFDPTEFAALTALQQAQLTTILSAGLVDMANTNLRAIVAAIFPAAGPTRTALTALWNAQTKTQSRAQERFGEPVLQGHIQTARSY